jgi:GT2 family glycosyltransferase
MTNVMIVIVNYNGYKYQNDCIKSLYAMDDQDFEIVVVDSGSTDQSIEVLKKEYPDVHVILAKENVGVAKGNNIGIEYSRQSGAKYTLIMNNDVEVDPKMLTELVKHADEKTVTVPKIYYYDAPNRLWYAGGSMSWTRGSGIHTGMDEEDTGQYDTLLSCTYSPSCCILIDNQIFDAVGVEDENYFMYYDDVDLCARLIDGGYKIVYVPTAKLWHKVSSSSGGNHSKTVVYYIHRNKFYFIRKYKDRVPGYAVVYKVVSLYMKYWLSLITKSNDRIVLRAYKDFKAGKMGRQDLQ